MQEQFTVIGKLFPVFPDACQTASTRISALSGGQEKFPEPQRRKCTEPMPKNVGTETAYLTISFLRKPKIVFCCFICRRRSSHAADIHNPNRKLIMANGNVAIGTEPGTTRVITEPSAGHLQTSISAVSWGAIFAGAAAAAALSLILLVLGVGLGLSSVSPWADSGISATTFGISTIAWLSFTQLAASGIGGYLAGRLRTRWVNTLTDEIYFRDTAHGFLAWAVATLVTAALLTSVIGSIVSGGAKTGASLAGGIAATAAVGGATAVEAGKATAGGNDSLLDYFVDSLFRQDPNSAKAPGPRPGATTAAPGMPVDNKTQPATSEVSRIMANAIRAGAIPPEDVRYVAQLVSHRTGMSQQDAEKRVEEMYSRAQTKLKEIESSTRETADKARKTSAYSALWFFVSLLLGAFTASLTATWGSRRRDV